jgi:phage terminase Nu1 subunit (DNA packaging protein)
MNQVRAYIGAALAKKAADDAAARGESLAHPETGIANEDEDNEEEEGMAGSHLASEETDVAALKQRLKE